MSLMDWEVLGESGEPMTVDFERIAASTSCQRLGVFREMASMPVRRRLRTKAQEPRTSSQVAILFCAHVNVIQGSNILNLSVPRCMFTTCFFHRVSGSMCVICYVVLKHNAQDSALFGSSGTKEMHGGIDTEDVESDGTDGSVRMRAARGLCPENQPEREASSSDDESDDGWLFLSDASGDEEPELPVPNPAGYLFTDPDDLRTRFARVTEFRGQRSIRCYKHPGCSWLLPRMSRVTTQAMIRWALAGSREGVVTKDDHLKLRAEFAADE